MVDFMIGAAALLLMALLLAIFPSLLGMAIYCIESKLPDDREERGGAMTKTDYKHQYEQMKKMVETYQDEVVPGLRAKIEELEAENKRLRGEEEP